MSGVILWVNLEAAEPEGRCFRLEDMDICFETKT